MTELIERSTNRRSQGETRRSHILEAALHLFSQKGFENTSIKDLAEEAGIAPGLIYHYFESKQQILMAVMESHGFSQECKAMIEAQSAKSVQAGLPVIATAYYELLGKKEQLLRIFCREAMTDETLGVFWVNHINDAVATMSRYLAAKVATGELRPHNTDISARMLLHPIAMMRLTGVHPKNLPQLIDCLLSGISAANHTKKGMRHA